VAIHDNKAMCKLICILTTPSDADVLCGSSDPALLVCTGVWGLLSLIALIVWLRWQGDHSSARDEPITEPPELLGAFHDASAASGADK
jgi:hypothetical protein